MAIFLDAGTDFWKLLQSGQVHPLNFAIYLALLALVALEGPIAIMLAGGAASAGYLLPVPVFLTASFGNMISDTLWYMLGYFGKINWVYKIKWLSIKPHHVDAVKDEVRSHVIRILLVTKLTNGLTIPILVATGLAKVPWRRWFPVVAFANLVIAAVFTSIGYFTVFSLLKIEKGLTYIAIIFSIVFFVVAFIYLRKSFKKRKERRSKEQEDSSEE